MALPVKPPAPKAIVITPKPVVIPEPVIAAPAKAPIVVPKPVTPPKNCKFVGNVQKGSRFGNSIFEAKPQAHQEHTNDFTCLDVLAMEEISGRHIEGCPHVGYWTSKACGCPEL